MGKPVSIVRGSSTATLYYGPDRARYKPIDDLNQASETETHYLGSVERIFKPGGVEVIRRDIDGEALVVRPRTRSSQGRDSVGIRWIAGRSGCCALPGGRTCGSTSG